MLLSKPPSSPTLFQTFSLLASCAVFQPAAFTQFCLCVHGWRPVFCSMDGLSETMWLFLPQQSAIATGAAAWGGTSRAPPHCVGILVGLISCGSCAHKSQLLWVYVCDGPTCPVHTVSLQMSAPLLWWPLSFGVGGCDTDIHLELSTAQSLTVCMLARCGPLY